jgi:hypothetical protein
VFPSEVPSQLWRPRSAPGEPELETLNKGSSPYFLLDIYGSSLALLDRHTSSQGKRTVRNFRAVSSTLYCMFYYYIIIKAIHTSN